MSFLSHKKKVLLLMVAMLVAIGTGGVYTFLSDIKDVKNVVVQHMVAKAWKAYKCKDGGFIVHFPTKPTVEEKVLPMPSGKQELCYSEYTSQPEEDVTYSVAFLDLPKKWTMFGTKTLLKESLNIIVENTPGLQIKTKEFNQLEDGRKVLDFQGMCGEKYVEGRLLLDGSTLFKIEAVHPSDEVNDSHIQKFLESFNLAFKKGNF